MTEAELIERARAGDHEAFAVLVKDHREAVYRASYHVLKDEEEALDVVQESLLKAYQRLDAFEERASFRTWARRIALNLSLNRLRDRKVGARSATSLPEGDLLSDQRAQSPGRLLEGAELKFILHQEIDKLSPKHALALRLHDIEGLTYAEIAEATGVKAGTVMSRIHYARLKLRERLARKIPGAVAGSEGRS